MAGCLYAGPITGLFNTGVNAGGTILSGNTGDCCNGLTEIHWLQNGGTAFDRSRDQIGAEYELQSVRYRTTRTIAAGSSGGCFERALGDG